MTVIDRSLVKQYFIAKNEVKILKQLKKDLSDIYPSTGSYVEPLIEEAQRKMASILGQIKNELDLEPNTEYYNI